jgi:uncharacterized protein YbaR (Trm112 family)
MHLLLTDRLICPRCGPEYGLILLAHEVRERRVLEGDLGCSNCRETYPVRSGFGDLRPSPRPPFPPPEREEHPSDVEPDEVVRLGAFLGVTGGPGTLLLSGPVVRFAGHLAALIGQVEVVGMDFSLLEEEEAEGVSRLVSGPQIPFFPGSFRGAVLSGEVGDQDLAEAARVVAPPGRVVILDGPEEAKETLEGLGLSVLLDEDGVVVAGRGQSETLPLVTLRGL